MDGSLGSGWVKEQEAALAAGVGALDPDLVLASEAPALWAAFDRIERLAAGAKSLLARRVADSRIWATEGCSGPAVYLARQAGISPGRAKDTLETSKRLADQPVLVEACRNGELSAPQAELISEAVAADPAAASRLVDTARRSTVGELRDACARTGPRRMRILMPPTGASTPGGACAATATPTAPGASPCAAPPRPAPASARRWTPSSSHLRHRPG